jgi:hypothetical protein
VLDERCFQRRERTRIERLPEIDTLDLGPQMPPKTLDTERLRPALRQR